VTHDDCDDRRDVLEEEEQQNTGTAARAPKQRTRRDSCARSRRVSESRFASATFASSI
jgi:hypothetical protein